MYGQQMATTLGGGFALTQGCDLEDACQLQSTQGPIQPDLNCTQKQMGMVLVALRSAKAGGAVTPIKTSHLKSTSSIANKSTFSRFLSKNRASKMRSPSA